MRKEDLLFPVFLLVPYMVMFLASRVIPERYAWINVFLGITVMVAMMAMSEWYLKVKYAGYKLLKAIVVPWRDMVQLIIDEIKVMRAGNTYLYDVRLAVPLNHPRYGKVREIYIEANQSLEQALRFMPKKEALEVMGMMIDHPSTDYAVLEDVSTVVDHGVPKPYFKLYPIHRLHRVYNPTEKELKSTIAKLTEENARLKSLVSELHQKVIRLEEEAMAMRDELKALLKSKSDIMKLAIEAILSFKEYYGNLIIAAKKLSSRRGAIVSIGKYVFYLGLAGLAVFILYTRPEIIVWMTEHWIQTLITIAVIGAIIGYVWKKR